MKQFHRNLCSNTTYKIITALYINTVLSRCFAAIFLVTWPPKRRNKVHLPAHLGPWSHKPCWENFALLCAQAAKFVPGRLAHSSGWEFMGWAKWCHHVASIVRVHIGPFRQCNSLVSRSVTSTVPSVKRGHQYEERLDLWQGVIDHTHTMPNSSDS